MVHGAAGLIRSGGWALVLVAALQAMASCTPSDAAPELAVSTDRPAAPPTDAATKLAQLLKVTGDRGKLYDDVRDVRAMLHAEDLAAVGDTKGATAEWMNALRSARGRFGDKAVNGWLRSYVSALGRKSDALVLARLILAETQDGRVSPYMVERGLTTDTAIINRLKVVIPEWLILDTEQPSDTLPPAVKGIPEDDPLLTKSASISCSSKHQNVAAWTTWVSSLPEDVKRYWQALVAQCSGNPQDAIAGLKAVYPKLALQVTTQSLALEAASRIVTLQRAIGLRTEAADTYAELLKLWSKPGVTPAGMGLDPLAMALRRIDETLWASRYRALVGDYENAKIHAQDAINLIANAYTVKPNLSTTSKEQLAAFRAEAYHTLAFRISVERQEFDSAVSLCLLGLQSSNLNREWTERLTWFAGLYEYLANRPESAKKRWEAMLPKVKDENQRAMIYFWLAKVYDRMGQKAESRFYLDAAIDDYPLSFYSTIAPTVAGFTGVKDWRDTFGEPRNLEKALVKGRNFGIDKLHRSVGIGPLLSRAEIMVAANLGDWSRMSVDELDEAMTRELMVEANVGAFVYLSRLAFSSGNYLKAISITTKTSRSVPGFWKAWPEQLLIYFPRPYREIYERNAMDNALDPELLLAISRQESGFSPEVRSSANALGVMQLIKPTAVRFAAELGLSTSEIERSLQNPDFNIKVGSRYLRFLNLRYKGFPPAIYGGYNAGEYAVDLWLKRRGHTDPLMFVELIPFGETKDYVKNVWRNNMVYQYLESSGGRGKPLPIEMLSKDPTQREIHGPDPRGIE